MTKRIRKLKQGVTLWIVWNYSGETVVKQVVCLGRPQAGLSGSLMVPTTCEFKGNHKTRYHPRKYRVPDEDLSAVNTIKGDILGLLPEYHSLEDMNILPNTYNIHRAFFSRRKALRYAALLDSGCQFVNTHKKDYHAH